MSKNSSQHAPDPSLGFLVQLVKAGAIIYFGTTGQKLENEVYSWSTTRGGNPNNPDQHNRPVWRDSNGNVLGRTDMVHLGANWWILSESKLRLNETDTEEILQVSCVYSELQV